MAALVPAIPDQGLVDLGNLYRTILARQLAIPQRPAHLCDRLGVAVQRRGLIRPPVPPWSLIRSHEPVRADGTTLFSGSIALDSFR